MEAPQAGTGRVSHAGRIERVLRGVLAAVAAALLAFPTLADAGASLSPVVSAPPVPLLWRVGEGPRTVYLLGTFHLLRAEDYPLHPSVYVALDDAESVLFELPGDVLFDPVLGRRFVEAGLRRDGRSLAHELGESGWSRLEAASRRVSLDPQALAPMRPWLAALTLSLAYMQSEGLDPALGMDRHLAERAARAGKTVGGLETMEQQIALFAEMSEAQARRQLDDLLSRAGELGPEVEWLHAQWRSGDADALYWGMAASMKARDPVLYARINTDRNEAWLPLIRARLDDPGTDDTLVAVGSLHLVGAEGLVQRLAELGYRVERVAGDAGVAPATP